MMDQIAMLCGYGVMIVSSLAIILFGMYAIASSVNECFGEILKAIRNTYQWSVWIRFHRIARKRKGESK